MLSLTPHAWAVGTALGTKPENSGKPAQTDLNHAFYFNSALLDKFTSHTRMHAELLGPCFKTGRF